MIVQGNICPWRLWSKESFLEVIASLVVTFASLCHSVTFLQKLQFIRTKPSDSVPMYPYGSISLLIAPWNCLRISIAPLDSCVSNDTLCLLLPLTIASYTRVSMALYVSIQLLLIRSLNCSMLKIYRQDDHISIKSLTLERAPQKFSNQSF